MLSGPSVQLAGETDKGGVPPWRILLSPGGHEPSYLKAMWGPQPWGFRDTQISHHLRILSRSLCNTKMFRMSHPFSLLKWIEKKELGREKWRQFKGIV